MRFFKLTKMNNQQNISRLKNGFCFAVVLFFFFEISTLTAQVEAPLTNDEIGKLINPDQKKWRNLFVNFGADFIEKQAINSPLLAQDIPLIPTELLYLGIGYSFRTQDYLDTFETELGFNYATSEETDLNFGNTYNEVQFQLRYERKFASFNSTYFSAGLQAKYLYARLAIFPVDAVVNLENVNASPNNTALQHQAFFVGPSIAFNWINPKNDRLLLRVIMNYDFNWYAENWAARYGSTLNSFPQDSSRYSLRLLIPLYF